MLSNSTNIAKTLNVAMSSNMKSANAAKAEKDNVSDRKNLENVKSFAKSQGKAKKSSSINEFDFDDDQIENESELLGLEEPGADMKSDKGKETESHDDDVMDLLNKKYPDNKHVDKLKDHLKEFFDNGRHFEDLEDDIQFQIKLMFSENDHP